MVRRIASAALGVLVTFVLFYAMQALIAPQNTRLEEAFASRQIEFVRLRRDAEVEKRKRELPERVKPETPPEPPDTPKTRSADMPSDMLTTSVAVSGPGIELAGGPALGEAPSDREVVPLVRIAPQYPARAASRDIEGWVEVQFTITPEGTVRDPEVVGRSSESTIFDREALRAIRKWKYKPKIENGQPVEQHGIRVRLDFFLDG